MTQEEYLKKFHEITDQMLKLTTAKNHDYAREDEALANFKEFGAVGVLVRISDKLQRIKNALWFKRNFVVADENIEDTMMDLAIYSVIMLILLQNERQEKVTLLSDKQTVTLLKQTNASVRPTL
jgi:hypothetical protein